MDLNKPIEVFVSASGEAVDQFLSVMDADTQETVVELFKSGHSLSLSHVISPSGVTEVLFECILIDGSRRTLASLRGSAATRQ